jgi:CO/xanthine dehydrogenase Mo-binding subunit
LPAGPSGPSRSTRRDWRRVWWQATTKRHPGVITHRTGIKKDGTLLFQNIDILLDGGGYCTLTPVVLSRAAQRCLPGFRRPQSLFAAELMVEHVAQRLGMSSVDLWASRKTDARARC